MNEIVLLALAAALNPTLVAASTVMMLIPNPKRLMLGYLLGALMTSITLGLVIISSFESSDAVSTTENTLSPAATLALGGIFLVSGVRARDGPASACGRAPAGAPRGEAGQGPAEMAAGAGKGVGTDYVRRRRVAHAARAPRTWPG